MRDKDAGPINKEPIVAAFQVGASFDLARDTCLISHI
jgi:hypothetical protein